MVGAMPLSFILVRKHLAPGESQVAIGVEKLFEYERRGTVWK